MSELYNYTKSAAVDSQPEPDLPKRNLVVGTCVDFPNPDNTIEVFIDWCPVKIPKGMTVLQACLMASFDIPLFCYHDCLSIAGNCPMCFVKIEKSPKS